MGVSRGRMLGMPAVILSGEVDRAALPELRPVLASFVDSAALASAMGRSNAPILLDLQALTFVDSGFISVLYDVLERLPEKCWVGIVHASPDVLRIFELAGLLGQPGLRVFARAEEAAKSVRRTRSGAAAA